MKKNHLQKGFTLIEMMVCLVLISVVAVISIGLLSVTNVNIKQSSSQRRIMDNLNFALEHMSRSITYGKQYSCYAGGVSNSCPSGSPYISFNGLYLGTASPISYERQLDSSTGHGYIGRSIAGGSSVSLTDPNMDIQELTFYVYNAEPYSPGYEEQPRVTVVIRGVFYAIGDPQEFFVQTTLSERDLKLP